MVCKTVLNQPESTEVSTIKSLWVSNSRLIQVVVGCVSVASLWTSCVCVLCVLPATAPCHWRSPEPKHCVFFFTFHYQLISRTPHSVDSLQVRSPAHRSRCLYSTSVFGTESLQCASSAIYWTVVMLSSPSEMGRINLSLMSHSGRAGAEKNGGDPAEGAPAPGRGGSVPHPPADQWSDDGHGDPGQHHWTPAGRSGHSECAQEFMFTDAAQNLQNITWQNQEVNRRFHSLADLQHHLMVSVPPGKESRDPRKIISGGQKHLPWSNGAKQRSHRTDAISEGCHQRDTAVRGILMYEVICLHQNVLLMVFCGQQAVSSGARKRPRHCWERDCGGRSCLP